MKLFLIILLSCTLMLINATTAHAELFDKPQSVLFNDQDKPTQNTIESTDTSQESDEDIDAELDKLLSGSQKFLAVSEAYRLSAQAQSDSLNLTWNIAPGYYLYDGEFSFNELTASGQNTIKGQRPPGKISFDLNFNKDVAKHYSQIKVTFDRQQFSEAPVSQLQVRSQGCADAGLCFPHEVDYLTIDWQKATVSISKEPFAVASDYWQILLMAGYALLGGLILNLMPCVFPVLSLKALSIVNTPADQQRRHGISYTVGTVISFGLIGAALLALRTLGNSTGWGGQLQSPILITLLIFLFVVMGLCLSGFIHFTSRFMSVGHKLTQGTSTRHSFFTGALAAVVASPCLGPFLGVAIGFAFAQDAIIALTIFMSMGFGMALPFLLLSFWPGLSAYLPKPGQWMDTFKQILAFPLYLTAIWLLWVLGRQVSSDAIVIILLGVVAIIFLGWLGKLRSSKPWIYILIGGLTAAWIAFNIEKFNNHDAVWEAYDPAALAQYRAAGKPVFINLTAAWCVTCLANEAVVFTDERLDALKRRGVKLIKGDLTGPNPEVSALLTQHNRAGIPLYLLYPAISNQPPEILPQILTPGGFDEAVEKLNLPEAPSLEAKKSN